MLKHFFKQKFVYCCGLSSFCENNEDFSPNCVRRLMLIIRLLCRSSQRISRWQTAEFPWYHQRIRYQLRLKRCVQRTTSMKHRETRLSLARWVFVSTFISAEICLLPGCHEEKSLCDDMVGKVNNYKSYQGYDRYGNIPYAIWSHSSENSDYLKVTFFIIIYLFI